MRDDPVVVDLVARARDGDSSAWAAIVDRYAPLVWSIGRQFRLKDSECEDVGQTVWLRLVETLPRLREPAALPGFIATTTRRECLRVVEIARRRKSQELHTDVNVADLADGRLPPVEHGMVSAELDAAMRSAFAQLSPKCQQLLVMLMQTPPLPYAEISARLDMPIGSIGPNRARCLDRLRRCPALAAWIHAETDRAKTGRAKTDRGGA